MVTIQEVAKEAGVSVATVSRVLNKSGSVSEKKRIIVENVISKLNYEPNMLGRNLRNSKSRMILAIMPNISNAFYAKIVQGIEDCCKKHNYSVLLCNTESDYQKENNYVNLLRQKLADGVIWMEHTTNTEFLNEIGSRYSIVQCSEFNQDARLPYVSIDNATAAYDAVRYLISIGHRKIAFINIDEKFTYAKLRKEGYLNALKEFNIPVKSEWIINSNLDFNDGKNAMKYLLSLKDRPTAVFAVSDILAIGALKAINEENTSTHSNIAVVGFDNIPFANMTNPTLTTIDQPMYKLGYEAASMLLKVLDNKDTKIENIILEHQLIIRESTNGTTI